MSAGWTRRMAVFGGCAALVAGVQSTPRIWDWWDDSFVFEPLDSPAGFRRLASANLGGSSAGALLAGIDENDPLRTREDSGILGRLCDALFPPVTEGEGVPVAVFSDYYCPYCRILDARLMVLADEGLIRLRHHETPIFGPASDWAARGAIAARTQGRGRAYFDRMVGTPIRANPVFLAQVAQDIGLDPDSFAAAMTSRATDATLADAAALARVFGFIGTPALVVGRTVLQGAITETNLRQLISLEREHAQTPSCA